MMTFDPGKFVEHLRVMHFIAQKVPPSKWYRSAEGVESVALGSADISVFYINLDSHLDRKEHIEKQLGDLALPYQRVSAIKEHYGLLGCLKSHIKALRLAKESDRLWTIVFEDDFAFQCSFEDAKNRIRFVLENSLVAPVWLGDWVVNGPAPLKHPIYADVKQANGACNNASCYFVRRDYIDVLLGTWEMALTNLVIDLRRRVEEKKANIIQEIGNLWWYSPDSAWAPLQIRDYWLLFEPELGAQQKDKFGSSLESSFVSFEKAGYLEVALNDINTHID